MAGYPRTKDILNSRVGFLTVQVRDGLDGWVAVKEFLDGTEAADLGLGMDPADVAVIRAAANAMTTLRAVAHGQAAQPEASDFFWDAKHLTAFD